jgi:hypothetical protein
MIFCFVNKFYVDSLSLSGLASAKSRLSFLSKKLVLLKLYSSLLARFSMAFEFLISFIQRFGMRLMARLLLVFSFL